MVALVVLTVIYIVFGIAGTLMVSEGSKTVGSSLKILSLRKAYNLIKTIR